MVAPAGVDPLHEAVGRAAAVLGGGRPVTVEGFLDTESGRTVYRVADQRTGDVLYQSPPDELLRLYANLRDARQAPLVRVEA